jgi:hypothetical protein
MHNTYEDIIKDCIGQALMLPQDSITNELLTVALGAANEHAEVIWLAWPWDNEKIDEFETPSVDSDGIITFGSDVESVRAIKAIGSTDATSETYRVWNQNDLLAAARGETVSSDRFIHLAADSSGNRRIQVTEPEDSTPTYHALALKKYTKAIIDDSYDDSNPTNTPTDYRVMTFALDRAEGALRAFIKDTLRRFQGITPEKNAGNLLAMAINRETQDSDKENRAEPQAPMYDEVGDWY